ncbi:pentapeptide repeat-containing protein [Frankia sp. CNm7]|uniref:Pentapeptide repeat-containing protein n=1 Tax=Frankia nepalensis TaxID=1836974 RepID=A0A937UNU5_9ACTN|nr:pentapeptide repeat-containing protein [Frankia nepalensis]MBL7498658.1 pentapeptide repeat-containing protein [Frankia nepalensis]MBL7509176.1 pentapeptide repeat-containing protein [Frankia nepalensis]MBL7519117.1 pentapeptide repeat-containing protein [Frankia nepalensis]MBL7628367.1 pentapeptide repeat-containing protein [Frankia nepalensis]
MDLFDLASRTLGGADLRGVGLDAADPTGARLDRADLTGTVLARANPTDALERARGRWMWRSGTRGRGCRRGLRGRRRGCRPRVDRAARAAGRTRRRPSSTRSST